jgi:hypothetical protein
VLEDLGETTAAPSDDTVVNGSGKSHWSLSGSAFATDKGTWSRQDKAERKARRKSGEADGDYQRFFDIIANGSNRPGPEDETRGERQSRLEAEQERLEKVTDLTLLVEATISKKEDIDLVEGLVAATTCYNRGVGAFLPLYERQKNAYKSELLWRLKVRREAALGNPPPVRVTKERPVYGKNVDARPKSVRKPDPAPPVKPVRPVRPLKPVKPHKRP